MMNYNDTLGIDFNINNDWCSKVFIIACRNGNSDMVKILMEKAAVSAAGNLLM